MKPKTLASPVCAVDMSSQVIPMKGLTAATRTVNVVLPSVPDLAMPRRMLLGIAG
jgi:hypothetical protein